MTNPLMLTYTYNDSSRLPQISLPPHNLPLHLPPLLHSRLPLPLPHPTSAVSSSADTSTNVTLDSTIAITTSAPTGTLTIPITPTNSGTSGSGDLTISVDTNNLTGYTLTMSSQTEGTALTHLFDASYTIPSTTSLPAAPASLPVNTWGYSTWADGQSTTPTTFSRVPPLSTPDTLRQTTTIADPTSTTLTFSAAADYAKPSGTYSNTLVFTATTNYVPALPACPVLTGKTYLQDIVAPLSPPYGQDRERVVLKDRRNNQDYYVQNIINQDGSCLAWMETNLRYAGGGNYDSSWGYPDDRDSLTLGTGTSNITPYYVDPGGSTDYTNTTANGGFYGYLYNWCAAMGGQTNACNSSSTSGFDTTTSICPAGWRLPTGASGGDFQTLNNTINSGSTSSDAGLRTSFLAVYSGLYDGSLGSQGTFGYYWSSTVRSTAYAYYLFFGSSYVSPGTGNYTKNSRFAVRCVL